MILLVAACRPPAVLVPADPCRVGGELGSLAADVTCEAAGRTVEATFSWDGPLRAGGLAGEWDGLSFFAAGTTEGGGGMSVGWRPGELGFEALEDDLAAGAGFRPEEGDVPDRPWVEAGECDVDGAGEVVLTGLPEAWAAGGTWTMRFDGGGAAADEVASEWTPDLPGDCPLSARAWSSATARVSCAGETVAEVHLLAPARYLVTLDDFGRVAAVEAGWSEAFDASCAGEVAEAVTSELAGDADALALDTTLFAADRGADGVWRARSVACGACDVGWAVDVEGLPDL
ncbi:MAG: hypothetical protein ACOZNI_07035 [Myxococcota bacterium]